MKTLLVLRQLTSVLDHKLAQVTRAVRLTPQDVLALGWMAQKPGIAGSNLADLVGRSRQNVQRSLQRLEKRGLIAPYRPSYRARAAGWGLTEQGLEVWSKIEHDFNLQELDLARRGVVTPSFLHGLDDLVMGLRRNSGGMGTPGFLELPREEGLGFFDL